MRRNNTNWNATQEQETIKCSLPCTCRACDRCSQADLPSPPPCQSHCCTQSRRQLRSERAASWRSSEGKTRHSDVFRLLFHPLCGDDINGRLVHAQPLTEHAVEQLLQRERLRIHCISASEPASVFQFSRRTNSEQTCEANLLLATAADVAAREH
mgnify:CR=1 FL=1